MKHEGKTPSTFAEKESFKALIKSMARDYNNEMNFQEAVREYYRAYAVREVGDGLSELLCAQRANQSKLGPHSSDFE